jgi:hypothetical protein
VPSKFPLKPDRERLAERDARRVLERASELDAARNAAFAVTDLRAAAGEAGISPQAFEQALAELEEADVSEVAPARARSTKRWRALALGTLAVAGLFTLFAVGRVVTPSSVPVLQESIVLRCLQAGEAATLIRPSLGPDVAIQIRPDAPRVITVRAPQVQLQRVKDLIARTEAASGACARP